MKKFIPVKAHGILDYIVVLILVITPSTLHFSAVPTGLAYFLALVHLGMTLLTNFAFGVIKKIPLRIHGWTELAVGILLLVVPWILGFNLEDKARAFFMLFGVLILIVWSNTDYKSKN